MGGPQLVGTSSATTPRDRRAPTVAEVQALGANLQAELTRSIGMYLWQSPTTSRHDASWLTASRGRTRPPQNEDDADPSRECLCHWEDRRHCRPSHTIEDVPMGALKSLPRRGGASTSAGSQWQDGVAQLSHVAPGPSCPHWSSPHGMCAEVLAESQEKVDAVSCWRARQAWAAHDETVLAAHAALGEPRSSNAVLPFAFREIYVACDAKLA